MNVVRLCRYPVKGLSVETLTELPLLAGEPVPGDRRYALGFNGNDADDAGPIQWRAKSTFLTLKRHEKLAALETRLDDATSTLELARGGNPVASGRLDDAGGRRQIEDFLAAYMVPAVTSRPHIVAAADGVSLTDTPEPFVSIVNLASVRELERATGEEIDPIRFRANIYFDSVKPWSELDWVGRDIAIGIVRLNVAETTGRCAATDVNPATGLRDRNILKSLQNGFGHTDMGVYATVRAGGTIAVGDAVVG